MEDVFVGMHVQSVHIQVIPAHCQALLSGRPLAFSVLAWIAVMMVSSQQQMLCLSVVFRFAGRMVDRLQRDILTLSGLEPRSVADVVASQSGCRACAEPCLNLLVQKG